MSQRFEGTDNYVATDDLKEFWGFYLLKGSKLTIRSCARLFHTIKQFPCFWRIQLVIGKFHFTFRVKNT